MVDWTMYVAGGIVIAIVGGFMLMLIDRKLVKIPPEDPGWGQYTAFVVTFVAVNQLMLSVVPPAQAGSPMEAAGMIIVNLIVTAIITYAAKRYVATPVVAKK